MFSEASQTEWRQPFDFPSISHVYGKYPSHVISGISLLYNKSQTEELQRQMMLFKCFIISIIPIIFNQQLLF